MSGDEFLDRLLKERVAAAKAYTPMQLWNGTPHLTRAEILGERANARRTAADPRPALSAEPLAAADREGRAAAW